ncbi:MAG TPA: hypothetical protein VGI57_05665 [Usitatibacter sp.]
MRRLIPVVLCSIALFAQAGSPAWRMPGEGGIDLDKPGALEALQRDNPAHYDAVMKKVDEAQSVAFWEKGLRNLGVTPGEPLVLSGNLKLSYPAQSRITVVFPTAMYFITVHHTKDPARSIPAQ